MSVFKMELNREQAKAVQAALDLYSRVCLGQLGVVTELVREGVVPVFAMSDEARRVADVDACLDVAGHMDAVRARLCYSRGSHLGIGSSHVVPAGARAYEVFKALSKVIAVDRNPDPDFRGVDYDGLGPRYTDDPEPLVTLTTRRSRRARRGVPRTMQARRAARARA